MVSDVNRYWVPSNVLADQSGWHQDDTCVVQDWEYDKIKDENKSLREKLECAQGDCRQAMKIIKKLTPQSELYQQIEHAAKDLPNGWEIRVCVEKDAGYVELYDPDGCEVDFPNSCETLALTVSDAIDDAIERDTK